MSDWDGMSESDFRGYVNRRIDNLEQKIDDYQGNIEDKLDQVLDLLRLGRIGAEVIRWTAGIGAAFATMWGAFHLFGPK